MFRRRRTEKMLSADELKTKLYSHLDKTGSLNRMRIELREKLISELLKKAAPVETVDVNNPVYTFDRTVLPLQISNWLIYDHLLRQGYQYALSIFVTEANFPSHPEKLLAACDILILLGLDSTSPEYKDITQMCSTSNAQFTHSLLVAVIKCLFDLTTREGRFSETNEEKETQEESEQRFLAHEKNLDLVSSELKESDKVLKQRKDSADLSLHDQVLLIKEEKEKEVQQLRHKLLQELDRLHSQEHKQQLEIEQFRNELQREKDDLFNEKEKLKQKEFLIDKEYENKLEKKTRELETDFISKIHAKENEQEILQQKLHEKEQKSNLLEMNLSNQRESYISLKREFEDMKYLHTTLQTKYSNLLDENTNLLKKFESMSDYAVLKGDLETKSRELKNLQLEFEEYHKKTEKEKESFRENLHKLDTKLRIKEPEILEAQRQLNLARDTLHMEEAVWHKERRKLEQEVMSSREMYQTLIQRIEEQKEDIQALHRTIHILHYQLTDKSARNTARVEPFIPNRSSFRVHDMTRKEPDLFRINRGTDDSPSKYRQNSLKFIEDAKNRISKLQQEADDLQYKSSVVYTPAPKMTSRVTSNPLQFNFSNEERFQPSTSHAVKPFVSELPSTNFENLIRNELPTLDLSFPANINSQLASAYRNVYQSESSVNSQETAAELQRKAVSDKSLKYSENVSKKSNAYSTLHSDTSSPKKNHDGNNIGLFKVGREPEVSKQFDFNNSNNSQVLSNKSFLKESSSSNTRLSVTMPSNVQGNRNSDFSVIKTGGGDDKLSEKYDENTQNLSGNILQETPTPAHVRTLTRNLNEGNESKSEAPLELENENKVSESVVEKTSAFQHVSETPVVVDLDAAWKRKSSLKSSILTPLHRKLSTEITSKEIDIAQTKSSQLQNVEQDLLASSSNKSNLSGHFKEADLSHGMEHQNMELQRTHQESNSGDSKLSENSKEVESSFRIGHQSMEQQRNIQESNSGDSKLSENSKEVESSHRMEPQSSSHESNSEATKMQETVPLVVKMKETEKVGTVSADISKPIDSGDEQKEVLSDQKPVHEDSLSELSEIHLSCGSEQEQQKEDSDNW
ncbi:hypothetical protein AVEN_186009-1 [Araneus ventricosus]|uniref:Uncharacterized protein n=1 Tax=Araneus ventricosus TaxID=182803 RepID=A0A4Y2NQT2_ARAVE|nr:hypothetical protein AVEN_268575-1 [Araneus ventricosus]GBN41935.1 hypothetical protein AVEN_186009-1 [Araneus ventricosus]